MSKHTRVRKKKIVSELDGLVNHSGIEADKMQGNLHLPITKAASPPAKRPRLAEVSETTRTTDLQQLACELSLPLFITIYQACAFMPQTFLCHRRYIGNIVRAAHPDLSCPTKKLLSTITAIDGQHQILQVGIPTTLWKATDATRTPHLRFLGPPTVSCLQCHHLLALTIHQQPSSCIRRSRLFPLW